MKQIRNVAVIAHVDHGKTTLVDALLKQTKAFRENQEEMQQELILDQIDLEKERGITIMAKVCSVSFDKHKLNIIDTPGHADFSGEVERTLGMADGALLIVDAQEGPMPQTRFVLKKALELNLKLIVIINKIDKKLARVQDTESKLNDLFLELATVPEQLDFPILYAIGRRGAVFSSYPEDIEASGDIKPLLEMIIATVPEPKGDPQVKSRMLVSALDYDEHLGRIVIGRINEGVIKKGQRLTILGANKRSEVTKLMVFEGILRKEVEKASAGEIVAVAGLSQAGIGHTLAEDEKADPLPTPAIAAPTIHLTMGANTSIMAGKEGKYTTSRQLGERLVRELENNVGLRVENLADGKFKISGRGELHLSILLETMRRQGYEMEVGKPEAIIREIDGTPHEPVERVEISVAEEFVGVINQELGKRQAVMEKMEIISEDEVHFTFKAPTRTLIGLRGLLLTLTKGTVVMSSELSSFEPLGETLPKLRKGAIIAATTGKASEYGLRNLKGRGVAFIVPGTYVYEGMIIGQNAKDDDIAMNVTKEKNLTNHRTKSHQGITSMAPDVELSLEEALDFLEQDELLEITPLSLRLRKKYLTELDRKRTERNIRFNASL